MYGVVYYFVSLQYLSSSHSKECRASFTRSERNINYYNDKLYKNTVKK